MMQPLVALAAALHVDQREIAVQLLAVQAEFQVAARDLLRAGSVAQQFEGAAVPQHHAAGAVIARGNVALEAAVLHGVIFHVGGEVFQRRDRAWALWAPPRISARHRSPGGNRNAGAWHRAAAHRNNWPRRAGLRCREEAPGVFSKRRLAAYSSRGISPFTSFRLHLIGHCSMLKAAASVRCRGVDIWQRVSGKAISLLAWFRFPSGCSAPRAAKPSASTCCTKTTIRASSR